MNLFLRAQSFTQFMVILEAQGGPNDGPNTRTDIRQDVDISLKSGNTFVLVSVEERNQALPHVENAKNVP